MLQYHHSIVSDGAGGSLICLPFVNQAGLDALANQFIVRDSDVFIVSYPKSGTNWVRQIVHLLTHDGIQGNQTLSEAVPLLEKEASDGKLAAWTECSERRCFISHLPYRLMPGVGDKRARYIFVARNPKDCAVSYFHFMASRGDLRYQGSWDEFVGLFMQGQVPYGLWFEHVLTWWQASQRAENIIFVTYEDLQKDLATAVTGIAHFIDIPLAPALCATVVRQSSFTAMAANPKVSAGSPQAEYSNRMLRKGVVGDWRNHFSPEQHARFDALYGEKMAGTGLRLAFDLEHVRKMTAYPLYDHAVPLQPAAESRAWLDSNATLSADRALHAANRQGWELLCPYAFEATWNGGPSPEDIDIRIEAPAADAPAFVQSRLGAGLLTFYPGYQFKTTGEQLLWVRGPINRPKDGISALEHLADASIVPCTVTVTWQCTRPDQTIRFAAGEPFGTILPDLQSGLENVVLDVVQFDDGDLDIYEQALQQLVDSATVQGVFQRLGATPVDAPPLLGIVFSRDRAMQLDATLRSFYLHCQDADEITLYVIYKTTNRRHAGQYAQLAQAYAADGKVRFVEETDFRQDVLRVLAARGPNGLAEQLLFLVDDNLFVRGFRLAEIRQTLADHPAALGFSLRLGANVTYRYTADEAQAVPTLRVVRGQIRSFDWTTAQGYFHYPLEVSSSVFRIDELTRLLAQLPFTNPNTLEGFMVEHSAMFSANRPALLCYEQAVAFGNPVNKVQTVYSNRAGAAPAYAAEQLAELFDQGYRVRVAAYTGFVPNACHQEVDLLYERRLDAAPPATQPSQPSNRHAHNVEHTIRIGYLILAHNVPNHFSRLVYALYDQHAHIYVHIDQKSNILPFQEHVPSDRVYFIQNRIPVYWSEYSTAQAILNLIAEALDHDPHLDYLCLLSGSDYPLQNAGYIRQFLAQRRGTEFINLLPMPNPTMGKPIKRLTQYRFRHDHAQKLAKRLGVPQLPVFSRDYRKYLGDLQPYGGSTWWALSRAACEYILCFAAQNRRVVTFFKNTLFPEEGLFQTIIGNSPFRMRVAHNLTYNDWSRPTPPHPAIIDEQHIRHFLAAPAVMAGDPFGQGELLFARKFPDDSEGLVAQLQR